ncbi:MAG: hypothetical protein U0263_06115 [Polyangiaceae bacterium]
MLALRRVRSFALALSVGALTLAACKGGKRKAAGEGPADTRGYRCESPFQPPSDGIMTCKAFAGETFEKMADSLRSECRGTFLPGAACPRTNLWGTCVDRLANGAEIRRHVYRRGGPPQGGDVTSESEARAGCSPPSSWLTGTEP